jgi:Holliday junction resolvase RusA-like endonuclease
MIIPFTPVAKGRPRVTRWGTYTPKKTQEYSDTVAAIAILHYKEPISCPCELRLTFVMPIPKSTPKKLLETIVDSPHIKRPDVDNLIKGVTDPLNGIAYTDDSLIYKLYATKVYGDEPMTIVELLPLLP